MRLCQHAHRYAWRTNSVLDGVLYGVEADAFHIGQLRYLEVWMVVGGEEGSAKWLFDGGGELYCISISAELKPSTLECLVCGAPGGVVVQLHKTDVTRMMHHKSGFIFTLASHLC